MTGFLGEPDEQDREDWPLGTYQPVHPQERDRETLLRRDAAKRDGLKLWAEVQALLRSR